MRLIDTNRPNYKTIGIQQMFGHERRAAINQRAKLMGRMVISSSMADAQILRSIRRELFQSG